MLLLSYAWSQLGTFFDSDQFSDVAQRIRMQRFSTRPEHPVAPMKQPESGKPVFLDPLRIQLPVGALTSILHRVSGLLLAVAFPLTAYLFDLSLRGPRGFAEAAALLDGWPSRIAIVLLVWGLSHHLLAGVRHLLMDIDVGSVLSSARRSAYVVNVAAAALAIVAALALL
ncbi:MAG TPA: succinate dehydrogenase, cytochrome b556 subunit [Casimicrobiaceae bacterium]